MTFKADARKIKRWREERHWSQEHVAEMAGIGLRTVQRVENGDPASSETLRALAAAYNVDVMALAVDPDKEASDALLVRNARGRAALQMSFWIHLAAYGVGALTFIGISLEAGSGFAMRSPFIWWTVGLAGHAAAVGIVEIVTRYQDKLDTMIP